MSGSSLYRISIEIKALPEKQWNILKEKCAGRIGSLLELLQGKLSKEVMAVVSNPQEGLFPQPKEISFTCSCPDSASLCKHIAACLYGIGARLDQEPELLFYLRGVSHEDLIQTSLKNPTSPKTSGFTGDLNEIFGIELEPPPLSPPSHLTTEVETTPKAQIKPIPKAKGKSSALKEPQKQIQRASFPQKGSSLTKTNPKMLKASLPQKTSASKAKTSASKAKTSASKVLSSFTGDTLKQMCERFDLTVSQMAYLLDLSASKIQKWKSQGTQVLVLSKKEESALKSIQYCTKEEVQEWLKL